MSILGGVYIHDMYTCMFIVILRINKTITNIYYMLLIQYFNNCSYMTSHCMLCFAHYSGKRVDVSRGPTKTATCDVCKTPLSYKGEVWWVVCNNCSEATVSVIDGVSAIA